MNVHSGSNGYVTLAFSAVLGSPSKTGYYLEISGKLEKDFKTRCMPCGRVFWWHMGCILEGEKVDVESLLRRLFE